MILHVYKDKTDALQSNSVANEFISRNSSRMQIFDISSRENIWIYQIKIHCTAKWWFINREGKS